MADIAFNVLLLTAIASAFLYAVVLLQLWTLRGSPVLLVPDGAAQETDEVGVVIAARDEAEGIVGCLNSVLADAAVSQVILVDDHSKDATAELAGNIAAADPRLQVISAPDLPAGWIGKSHALHYGARLVESPYLLFADADVKIERGVISAAVRKMRDEKLDHLSGFFKIKCATIGEEVCAPMFATTATITLFGAAKTGSATGAFNMIGGDFYRKLGGHEQIKAEIVDDVYLARLAAGNDGRTEFVDLSSAVSVRLFEGLSGFFRAVVRSSQSYLRDQLILPLFGGCATALVGVLTVSNVAMAGRLLLADEPADDNWPTLFAGIAILAYALGVGCAMQVRRFHDGRFVWSLIFPLPIIVLGMATFTSALRKMTGRGVQWRGRAYEIK